MRSKSKRRKETHTHVNVDFERVAKRVFKKAFLSDQHKEIEENNSIRKIRDLVKKIRGREGTSHVR